MIGLNIRLKDSYTTSHARAIEIINTARKTDELLGVDSAKWELLLSEVEKETGIKFNHSVSENGENIIEEEGYIEPTPDHMMLYAEEIATYNNIKSTHELGLITDEEMEECSEYMKSIYPNEKTRMAKLEKPELFEKFRNHR